MITFLKELPNIYIVFFCFLLLIIGFFITRDDNLFTLANLSLGAIIGIARYTTKRTDISGDVENVNVNNGENMPPNP